MKLRTGKTKYKLPISGGRIDHAFVSGNSKYCLWHKMLLQVSANELPRKKGTAQVRAIPTCFCLIDNTVEFWPAPDKPYTVILRYQPPMQEF
jgi:hypothetical protein